MLIISKLPTKTPSFNVSIAVIIYTMLKKKDNITKIVAISVLSGGNFVVYGIKELRCDRTLGRLLEIGVWLGIFIGSFALHPLY